MDYMALKGEDLLEHLNNDIDMLLPEEAEELKSELDEIFLESLMSEESVTGDSSPHSWEEVFPHLSDLSPFSDCLEVKEEAFSPLSGTNSASYSDSGSSSSDEKYTPETPPVSPPRDEFPPSYRVHLSPPPPPQNHQRSPPPLLPVPPLSGRKSTLLKINPNNIKIIRTVNGLKTVCKERQIVLPKEVLQNTIKVEPQTVPAKKACLVQSAAQINGGGAGGPPLFLANNSHNSSSRQLKPLVPLRGGTAGAAGRVTSISSASVTSSSPAPPHTSAALKLRPPSTLLSTSSLNDLNIKALKRQQRMIKNRESACLSRKKKKEYVTTLENRVAGLEQENSHLKSENERLKGRLKEFELRCVCDSRKRSKLLSSSLKKTSALLAVLLMVSLNIGSLRYLSGDQLVEGGGTAGSSSSMRSSRWPRSGEGGGGGGSSLSAGAGGGGAAQRGGGSTGGAGRALLWDQSSQLDESSSGNNTSSSSSSETTADRSICPAYINQTESLRLEKELRRWIETGVKEKYQNSTSGSAAGAAGGPSRLEPPAGGRQPPLVGRLLAGLQAPLLRTKRSPRWGSRLETASSAVDVYRRPPLFPGSLPRRDDTFYVFSFSGDHLLVPALAHDKTLRPKMSFLIPTSPLNDSVLANGSMAMMQVDCEVLATKSVHLTEEDLRTFRRPTAAAAHPPLNKNSTSSNVNVKEASYRPYFLGQKQPPTDYDRKFDSYLKPVYRTSNSLP